MYKRNSSTSTKVSEEAGGGGVQGGRAEIPLEPAVKTMVRQEVGTGAQIRLQPLEDPHQSRWMHEGVGRACHSMLEHSVPERLKPVEGTHTGAVQV